MRDEPYIPIHTNPLRGLPAEVLERYRLLTRSEQVHFIAASQLIDTMPLGWQKNEYEKLIKVFFPPAK
jgi:hypothetical protein